MKQKFFITTAIDYPNGAPHLGHAYEKVVSDCYARWYRLMGNDVFFLTGTDENGQKLSKAAEQAGASSTQNYVDENVLKFRKLCADLKISNNDFIRTTESRHYQIVAWFWEKLKANGDIYLDRYSGHYCLACEAFYTETQSKNGKCPVHETDLQFMEENGYFFRLSKYQDWITEYIKNNPDFLFPSNIRSELLSRLDGDKLLDLSISRPNQGWGIPVPDDKDMVVYTWFDALINYYTGAVLDVNSQDISAQKNWPASMHVIGKDISWFHSVIWPSMLKSAGLEIPKQVYVHGMVLGSDGKRMSKTAGNGVSPEECLEQFHIDTLKYYLLKAIPSGQDGAFSTDDVIRAHNNELANEYGNLLMRVVKLSLRSLGSIVKPSDVQSPETQSKESVNLSGAVDFKLDFYAKVKEEMQEREHHRALNTIWSGVRQLNSYINQKEPWKMKDDPQGVHRVMYTALLNLNFITVLLTAFIPDSAESARKLLGAQMNTEESLNFVMKEFHLSDGTPLFPRIETKKT